MNSITLSRKIKAIAETKGIEVNISLKNIIVNGNRRGCSGFIKLYGNVVYVNTEKSEYSPLKDKNLYRYAGYVGDFSSNSIKDGNNRFAKDEELPTAIIDLLMNRK